MQLLNDCKGSSALDTISYNAAITAGEKGGQQKRAVSLLQAMRAEKIWPDATSYSAAISACAQGTCWERALELLEDQTVGCFA